MNLRPILLDTQWALIVTDIADQANMDANIHTQLRITKLRSAGLSITNAGALAGGGLISPGMFIHNISSDQLKSIEDTDPPMILCPSYLHFRTGLHCYPDLSTLSVRPGIVLKDTARLAPHLIKRGRHKQLHLGLLSTMDLNSLPTDDPSIPFRDNEHVDAFVYSTNRYTTPERHRDDLSSLCNIRGLDIELELDRFVHEVTHNRLTASSLRFRKVLTDVSKRYLRDPMIFGFRYKDAEGSYV